jgi:hypothetical protein
MDQKIRTRPNTNNMQKRVARGVEHKVDEDYDIFVTDNENFMNVAGRRT